MTIYTAGYAHRKTLPPQAVNVARWTPKWVDESRMLHIRCLAPNNEVWRLGKNGGDWKAAYRRQLHGLAQRGDLADAMARLPDGAVLMCWEEDANDCHRLLAAKVIAELSAGRVVYGGEYTRHDPQMRLL